MSEKTTPKITRRDAIKLLGAAAGATALANLPSKWSKPELISGVLPAHAQTSLCSAVFLEVLSTDGSFVGSVQSGPNPDETTGSGGAGSTATWYCQSGCLYFFFDLAGGTTGQVRITTLAGTFIEDYTDVNSIRDIVIELDTGAYDSSAGFGGTAGSCNFGGGGGPNGGPNIKARGTGQSIWGK